ncbi:N-acetyltransferase [Aureimonas flava]|uniref:N-acetyltransferase n=1 Tax=Aureimonas flava TaxID=2320271 RepID=A0A3A1WMF4_9HYPH|nr:GNAT family N-acetyltransferase [Aureimonas flava]RIY01558.1 N-acetyltransferase [Aureimonas flava]
MNGEPSGDDGADFTVRVVESLSAVEPAAWDVLADPQARPGALPHPFTRRAFLASLEEAGCVGGRTGWLPQHLLLEDAEGRLLAAVPAYLKGNSQGEYVFDHGWADAFERAGGRYYPKLQVSVPFTPATGPRLLVGNGPGADVRRGAMVSAIAAYVRQTGVSSAHATFLEEADLAPMLEAGFLHRTDQQFHFVNRGYATYDEFLETLASRKRKGLRKERREAVAAGISIERLAGAEIGEEAWDAFFGFYMDTGSRKWGRPYLNRAFFRLIAERMPEAIVLVMARRAGRYVAGALNFVGGDRIFGRYWGCVEDHPFLHFEVCYHQAIDYAIEHGLAIVEAGAQGEHKLARGYEPVITHSAHDIAHSGLRSAIEDYLERERRHVLLAQPELAAATPFRKGDPE